MSVVVREETAFEEKKDGVLEGVRIMPGVTKRSIPRERKDAIDHYWFRSGLATTCGIGKVQASGKRAAASGVRKIVSIVVPHKRETALRAEGISSVLPAIIQHPIQTRTPGLI